MASRDPVQAASLVMTSAVVIASAAITVLLWQHLRGAPAGPRDAEGQPIAAGGFADAAQSDRSAVAEFRDASGDSAGAVAEQPDVLAAGENRTRTTAGQNGPWSDPTGLPTTVVQPGDESDLFAELEETSAMSELFEEQPDRGSEREGRRRIEQTAGFINRYPEFDRAEPVPRQPTIDMWETSGRLEARLDRIAARLDTIADRPAVVPPVIVPTRPELTEADLRLALADEIDPVVRRLDELEGSFSEYSQRVTRLEDEAETLTTQGERMNSRSAESGYVGLARIQSPGQASPMTSPGVSPKSVPEELPEFAVAEGGVEESDAKEESTIVRYSGTPAADVVTSQPESGTNPAVTPPVLSISAESPTVFRGLVDAQGTQPDHPPMVPPVPPQPLEDQLATDLPQFVIEENDSSKGAAEDHELQVPDVPGEVQNSLLPESLPEFFIEESDTAESSSVSQESDIRMAPVPPQGAPPLVTDETLGESEWKGRVGGDEPAGPTVRRSWQEGAESSVRQTWSFPVEVEPSEHTGSGSANLNGEFTAGRGDSSDRINVALAPDAQAGDSAPLTMPVEPVPEPTADAPIRTGGEHGVRCSTCGKFHSTEALAEHAAETVKRGHHHQASSETLVDQFANRMQSIRIRSGDLLKNSGRSVKNAGGEIRKRIVHFDPDLPSWLTSPPDLPTPDWDLPRLRLPSIMRSRSAAVVDDLKL